MSVVDDLVEIAEGAGIVRVYAAGEVPGNPGYPYAVIGTDTGTPGLRRVGGGTTRHDLRVTVQAFSRTNAGVLELAGMADAAFEDKVLGTAEGRLFSMREAQTPVMRDPDDSGVLYVLHTYKILEA